MLAFEVVLNGQRIAIAGAEDLNVLNGMVTAVGKLGSKASGTKAHPKGYDLHLSVGGLTGRRGGIPDEHVRWEEMKKLKVGDEVLIRVRRATVADPPKKAMEADRMNIERNERQEFKWAKSRYLKLRRKYERTRDSSRIKERR